MAKSVGASRYVYNWGLAESQRCYELTGKRPKLGELKTRLVELKKTECPVRGMQRNRHLALSVSDAGFGELRRQLAYKCDWYGATLIVADRWFPSSKTCSSCGSIKQSLSLNERVFHCDACGLSLDRDENAAINLRKLGLARLPEGLREVTPVERKALASALAAGVKPASLKQEASGSPRSRRATQRREERLAGAVTSGR